MGTDIHLYAEQRLQSGTWVPVFGQEAFIWRRYELFSRLAGVRERDGAMPISQPRGVPADVSDEIRGWLDDGDYHSHSWISGKEFTACFPRDVDDDFWVFGRYVSLICREFYEWRFVFAFDN
jgi:hypothetical protein